MTIDMLREILLWSLIINIGLLLWWALFFLFAHDFIYRMHGKWFNMPVETFNTIHYAGMAFFKILIFVFVLVPYLALLIVT
ncbi:MAG: hypothetical protein JW983_09275 [Elusimicrobia bacterium]|nr:hypothetical protein [Elusimicrobiota bacterium]